MFWIGDIFRIGYIREPNKSKEVKKLRDEFNAAKTFEEKEGIEDQIQFEKELMAEEKKTKTKRGPIIIKTTRPGIMHEYQDY